MMILLSGFVAGCETTGPAYTTGERRDINCRDFPLEVTLPPKSGYPVKCTRRNTKEPILTATDYHMYFRFVEDDRSFANILFAQAGDLTFIIPRSVVEKTKSSRNVRSSATNWGETSELRIGNRKYQYVTFDMPKNRSCIAYNGYEGYRDAGHEQNFYGYLCSTKKRIQPAHLRDLLSHLKIRR
jgi:hypothetical protein